MLKQYKLGFFNRWFAGQADKRLRRHFDGVTVQNLEAVRAAAKLRPLLLVANHSTWWDALVLVWLSVRLLKVDATCLMDADNLEHAPFFRLVGAFGAKAGQARDGARALRYAITLLQRPGQAVWWFPQGAERPQSLRPLGFLGGSMWLADHAPQALVVPVALRYEFAGTVRPYLYVRFGTPYGAEDVARRASTHEAQVTALLDGLDDELCGRAPKLAGEGFDVGGHTLVDSWPTRVLSAVCRAYVGWMQRRQAM